VDGEVEVVPSDAIDGAVQITDRRLHGERRTAPAQIAQQEAEAQPGREIVARGSGLEGALSLLDVEHERLHGPQGHDDLGRAEVDEVSREPIAPERPQAHPGERTVVGAHREDAPLGLALAQDDGEPTAQLESTQPQALLLLLQVELLRVQFMLELPGEVVEEMVPAHAVTVAIAPDARSRVFHSCRPGLDN